MRLTFSAALCATLGLAGCTLLVHFDPDGQPCDSAGHCLQGYSCVDGRCLSASGDSGTRVCPQGCPAGQLCHLGACEVCAATESRCADGEDDDCDGLTDCADPDCIGRACDDGNRCTSAEVCRVGGSCGGGIAPDCKSPRSSCMAAVGHCDPATGDCAYPPLDAGLRCDDGDPCTDGDHCDGAGACLPGAGCATTNPCQTSTCVGASCALADRANGTSCGATDSLRCCGGTCIDISSNPAHCGGCGLSCAAGFACESVSATSGCPSTPSNTTGRCRCALDVDCPVYQVCTTNQTYAQRCAPPLASGCASGEVFHDIASCPNYCSY